MTSYADELDKYLTEKGFPVPAQRPDLSAFGYSQDDDSDTYSDIWALFQPLWTRGWTIHFDAEGQFFEPDEHALLIKAFLHLAGVDPIPAVRDTWIRQQGWVFEISQGERHISVFNPEPSDQPSDYVELWLIKAIVEDWLGPDWILIDPTTGDQTAFCCLMPKAAYDALCEGGWIDPYREENFGEPAPDELILSPSWDVDEFMEAVVRMTPEACAAKLDGAPRDWLAHL